MCCKKKQHPNLQTNLFCNKKKTKVYMHTKCKIFFQNTDTDGAFRNYSVSQCDFLPELDIKSSLKRSKYIKKNSNEYKFTRV